MYISSYLTLNTALSGVEAAQEELDTTGQNITNANTAGYEEQTVNLVESPSLDISGSAADGALQLGTGVDATGISNTGDPYLDAAWRQQNASTNSAGTTQTYMQQIQTALNEPSTSGINSQLSTFWSDWNDLADNPNSAAAQQAVVEQGQSVSQSFNSLSTELNGSDPTNPTDPANDPSILGQVNSQYMATMEGPTASGASGGTLYNDAYNIASLNYSIVQAQAAGQSPNDLIDQRNAASGQPLAARQHPGPEQQRRLGHRLLRRRHQHGAGERPGRHRPRRERCRPVTTSAATARAAHTRHRLGGSVAGAVRDARAAAGTSAASLATTVGGTLGSLIGLAGYSASGFGNLGTPTFAAGVTSYATPAAPTQVGTIGTISASLDQVAADLANEVNNPTVTGTTTQLTLNAPFFTPSSGTTITAATLSVSSSLAQAAATGITPQAVSSATAAGGNTPGHDQRPGLQPRGCAAGHDRRERQRQRRRSG